MSEARDLLMWCGYMAVRIAIEVRISHGGSLGCRRKEFAKCRDSCGS